MRERFANFFAVWLTHRKINVHLAILAIVLTLPALWVGWQLDDHFQRLVMLGTAQIDIRPINTFSTLRGDPTLIYRYMDDGILPWWTTPNYSLVLFRFLSIFSMWLDYQLWPNSSVLMHLQSLLWYAALVVAVGYLYRRTMGVTLTAGLAALLYTVDDAHAFPTAWLANRNALLATFFGVLCLLAYDIWRRNGSIRGAILSPICLALALLSGEMGMATAGYLLAYAIFLDQASWRRRLQGLVPNGCVLITWALIYRCLGFGSIGSGFYLDPLGNAVAFIKSFFVRAPLLLFGQWSPIPAETAILVPKELAYALWLASFGLITLIIFIFLPLARKDRLARFWCLGMFLSLLPISAVPPSNRLLFFVSLGAMGLLAQFLTGLFGRDGSLPASRTWRILAKGLAVYLVVVHLILAPIIMPIGAYSVKPFGEPMVSAIASVPDDQQIAQQDLVLVNPPDHVFFVGFIPTLKSLEGKPFPKRIRALATGPVPLEINRVDERTLRVRINGGLFSGFLGRVFRSKDDPLAIGEEINLTGMSVRVTELTTEGDPQEVIYSFLVPLEDSSLRWLSWKECAYVPFMPPPIGQSIVLPASRGLFDIFPQRMSADKE